MLSQNSTNLPDYDAAPYPGHAYKETHPDALATMGTIFGMAPPDVHRCSVLEVGCGDGNNLIPMAVSLPGSTFVGIDLSNSAIDKAQELVQRLGLSNIRFECTNLLDLPLTLGIFDYIIAHGFYSWVPPAVQARLLKLCDALLTPEGIAFISYNTNPAGHLRQAIRETMTFHINHTGGDINPVQQGREFLSTLGKQASEGSPWKAMLEAEADRLNKREDAFTLHDDLNPHYYPHYFADFVDAARINNLQFVSESRLRDSLTRELNPQKAGELMILANGDPIAYEQYLDFAVFQAFRRTLVCRTGISLDRENVRDRMAKLFIASPMREVSQSEDGTVKLRNLCGPGNIETNKLPLIAAFRFLESSWPKAVAFEELFARFTAAEPAGTETGGKGGFAAVLLQLALNNLVDLRSYPGSAASSISRRPKASPLSRDQAERGTLITTLLHTTVEIKDGEARRLLMMLDGNSDKHALAKRFRLDSTVSTKMITAQLQSCLRGFQELGLLSH